MKNIKRMLLLLLAFALLLSLTACGKKDSGSTAGNTVNSGTASAGTGSAVNGSEVDLEAEEELDDQALLVKGRLDVMYLGQYSQRYAELTGRTEADCLREYEENLEINAEYLARCFGVDYLSDELKAELVEVYKQLFSQVKYTVNASSPIDENNYVVTVEISPADLVEQMEAAREEALAPFYAVYGTTDYSQLSEEEYQKIDSERARYVIDLAKDKLASLGYLESETLAVQVTKGEDGAWSVVDSDLYTIDDRIVSFP